MVVLVSPNYMRIRHNQRVKVARVFGFLPEQRRKKMLVLLGSPVLVIERETWEARLEEEKFYSGGGARRNV